MEQIGAESGFANRVLQILIRSGQKADVELDGPRAADADEFALLKDAQQLGLQRQREFADFVEEHAATFGDLEQPFLLANSAGERPFLVPEQLAFEKRFRQCRAIQRHERLIFALAVFVNGTRGKLFARAAFAVDQNCGIAGSNLLNELVDLAHARALADHVVLQANLGAQALILAAEALELAGVLYGNCGKAGDGGQKLQIIFREGRAGACRIEVDDSERAIRNRKRHAEERVHRRSVIVRRGIEFAGFVVKDGDAVLDDTADQ